MTIDETQTEDEAERQRRRRVKDDDELLIVKHKKEWARCVTLGLPTGGADRRLCADWTLTFMSPTSQQCSGVTKNLAQVGVVHIVWTCSINPKSSKLTECTIGQ